MCSALIINFSIFFVISVLINQLVVCSNDYCDSKREGECTEGANSHMKEAVKHKWNKYLNNIKEALSNYQDCNKKNCSCHRSVIKEDLLPFKTGITSDLIEASSQKGTKYQIIGGKVYRQDDCMFPARCSGIEHFLLKIASKLPDLEMIVNTRDWPQINKHFSKPLPVFSFSKTKDYYDIMYPAWAFWEGGPAIKLYPQGMGKWGEHRKKLAKASKNWSWQQKHNKGFFRGSRTSSERDQLILLSRENPELVDAQYTKNQAWKSDADTLNAAPAEEVSLEDHCQYRYLFNFRGVAASFRFKHLFLCGSLVFHVGSEWVEFFYPAMRPWVHYIPVPAAADKNLIKELLDFAKENENEAQAIAERGQNFIENHLRMSDIECYWLNLLKKYGKLIKYDVIKDTSLKLIVKKT